MKREPLPSGRELLPLRDALSWLAYGELDLLERVPKLLYADEDADVREERERLANRIGREHAERKRSGDYPYGSALWESHNLRKALKFFRCRRNWSDNKKTAVKKRIERAKVDRVSKQLFSMACTDLLRSARSEQVKIWANSNKNETELELLQPAYFFKPVNVDRVGWMLDVDPTPSVDIKGRPIPRRVDVDRAKSNDLTTQYQLGKRFATWAYFADGPGAGKLQRWSVMVEVAGLRRTFLQTSKRSDGPAFMRARQAISSLKPGATFLWSELFEHIERKNGESCSKKQKERIKGRIKDHFGDTLPLQTGRPSKKRLPPF